MQGSENVRCSAVYALLRFVTSILVLVAISGVSCNINEAFPISSLPYTVHEYDSKYTLGDCAGDQTDTDYLQECLPASATSFFVPFGLAEAGAHVLRSKWHATVILQRKWALPSYP